MQFWPMQKMILVKERALVMMKTLEVHRMSLLCLGRRHRRQETALVLRSLLIPPRQKLSLSGNRIFIQLHR